VDELHVVFGAGGGAGGAVVRALAETGQEVRAVTRSGGTLPAGVEDVRADARDRDAVRRACEEATVVYHCVNVPYGDWEAVLPGIMDALIDGASRAGARLVYCDNLYMYGPVSGPIREDSPARATGAKGRLRIRLADTLLAAHADGRVEATVGRGSDFFGPGAANTVAGMLVFPAVVAGRKAHWLGSLDAPHSLNYIDDFARGLVTLGRADGAPGEVWHLPPGETVTGRAFVERAFAAAGRPPRVGLYRSWMIRLLGIFDRQMRELMEVLYQFEKPFVLDGTKFTAAFGDPGLTPLDEAIERTLAWQRGRS
jgi:nucleoside-diphosphate-sugar epimerase